jgi:hypothetical protein
MLTWQFTIIVIVCIVAVVAIVAILKRGRQKLTGEVCIRAGVWRCTVCGELIPLHLGGRFPPCENNGTRWEYAGKSRDFPNARG